MRIHRYYDFFNLCYMKQSRLKNIMLQNVIFVQKRSPIELSKSMSTTTNSKSTSISISSTASTARLLKSPSSTSIFKSNLENKLESSKPKSTNIKHDNNNISSPQSQSRLSLYIPSHAPGVRTTPTLNDIHANYKNGEEYIIEEKQSKSNGHIPNIHVPHILKDFQEKLDRRERSGNRRRLKYSSYGDNIKHKKKNSLLEESLNNAENFLNRKKQQMVVDFSSNDYLGLANDFELYKRIYRHHQFNEDTMTLPSENLMTTTEISE